MKQLPDQVDKLQEAIQAAYEKNVTCYNISRSESISGPAPDLNLSVTNKVSGYKNCLFCVAKIFMTLIRLWHYMIISFLYIVII